MVGEGDKESQESDGKEGDVMMHCEGLWGQ